MHFQGIRYSISSKLSEQLAVIVCDLPYLCSTENKFALVVDGELKCTTDLYALGAWGGGIPRATTYQLRLGQPRKVRLEPRVLRAHSDFMRGFHVNKFLVPSGVEGKVFGLVATTAAKV